MSGVIPVSSTVTVTTAGTRTQVTANTGILASSVYFEALGSNTGYIYVGTSTVSATSYIARLAVGESLSIGADGAGGPYRARGQGLQLSGFYVDCSVSGEKVQVTYQTMVSAGL